MQAIADDTAVHLDIGIVNTAQVIITTAKSVTAVFQTIFTHTIAPGLVMEFFFVFRVRCVIIVAYIAIVDHQVGCAKHSTTLTTAIGITLNGRHTFRISQCCRQSCWLLSITQILTNTYYNIAFTKNIIVSGTGNREELRLSVYCYHFALMLTDTTLPAATIDVTGCTTFDIGVGLGSESRFIL